ncbi:hypothetical protein ESA_00786 [Cronobacter sakazakii ATCC BAA-894]|uniref:Uncharacterized protein n=1 Tax=Cronobacter sakazakii (strain ATCC BAA-894) TaxID=290339 RepID=A7ML03_CROS8|nr:hypothetical protein ESA_00786 [Cronobacter sakazakii ATCC BAA-894]
MKNGIIALTTTILWDKNAEIIPRKMIISGFSPAELACKQTGSNGCLSFLGARVLN